MQDKMKVLVLLGTARKGRKSEAVADLVLNRVKNSDLEGELMDVRDFKRADTRRYSKKTEPYKKKVEEADGLIIVSPEYNNSFPGELKILLDSLYEEYDGLPVGIVSVSAGSYGGVRMIKDLRNVCVTLGMTPVGSSVNVEKVDGVFDREGNLIEDDYLKYIDKLLKKFRSFLDA